MQHSFLIAQPKLSVVLAKTLTSERDQLQGPSPEGYYRQNYFQGDMSEGSNAAWRMLVMVGERRGEGEGMRGDDDGCDGGSSRWRGNRGGNVWQTQGGSAVDLLNGLSSRKDPVMKREEVRRDVCPNPFLALAWINLSDQWIATI